MTEVLCPCQSKRLFHRTNILYKIPTLQPFQIITTTLLHFLANQSNNLIYSLIILKSSSTMSYNQQVVRTTSSSLDVAKRDITNLLDSFTYSDYLAQTSPLTMQLGSGDLIPIGHTGYYQFNTALVDSLWYINQRIIRTITLAANPSMTHFIPGTTVPQHRLNELQMELPALMYAQQFVENPLRLMSGSYEYMARKWELAQEITRDGLDWVATAHIRCQHNPNGWIWSNPSDHLFATYRKPWVATDNDSWSSDSSDEAVGDKAMVIHRIYSNDARLTKAYQVEELVGSSESDDSCTRRSPAPSPSAWEDAEAAKDSTGWGSWDTKDTSDWGNSPSDWGKVADGWRQYSDEEASGWPTPGGWPGEDSEEAVDAYSTLISSCFAFIGSCISGSADEDMEDSSMDSEYHPALAEGMLWTSREGAQPDSTSLKHCGCLTYSKQILLGPSVISPLEGLTLDLVHWTPHWQVQSSGSMDSPRLWTDANPNFIDLTDVDSDEDSSDEMDESV